MNVYFKSYFIASMLLLFASLTPHAWANSQTILLLGDSLSSGYGLAQHERWATLIQANLSPHTLINASQSGETTAGGLTRLPHLLAQHHPNWLIIALGANDGLRGLPIASMRDNLQAMIDLAKRNKTHVMLIGMRLPPNYGDAYTLEFFNSFQQLAKKNKLPIVPFLLEGFATDMNYFQADHLHPNAAAQPKIRNTVLNVLRPALTQTQKK